MASIGRTWAVGREFESHVNHGNAVSRRGNFLMSNKNLIKTLFLGTQRLLTTSDHWRPCTAPYEDRGPRSSEGGESVTRLSLGRRLINLLPVAQRAKTLTEAKAWEVTSFSRCRSPPRPAHSAVPIPILFPIGGFETILLENACESCCLGVAVSRAVSLRLYKLRYRLSESGVCCCSPSTLLDVSVSI